MAELTDSERRAFRDGYEVATAMVGIGSERTDGEAAVALRGMFTSLLHVQDDAQAKWCARRGAEESE